MSTLVILNVLELSKYGVLVLLPFSATAHISKVNCAEMAHKVG